MRAPPESFKPTIGAPDLHREIHDLHDLRGVGFRQRSAEHGEVLREREDLASVDQAVAGDDAVAGNDLFGHPEIEAAMGDELVDFLERAGIEQEVDPLAGRQLAGLVLPWSRASPPPRSARRSSSSRCSRARRSAPSTACAFSQSFRNFSRPMLVSGWLYSCLDHRRRTRADVGAHAAPPRRCGSGGGSWRRALRS